MRIAVFLAAILDPKWTLSVAEAGKLPARDPQKLAFSPFDEAALELALRLRGALGAESCKLQVTLIGEESEKLARKIAAYKPDHVETVSLGPGGLADRAGLARILAERAAQQGELADLILIGREFGDCDDGAVPAMLAHLAGMTFVGLIHAIAVDGQEIRLQRRRQSVLESIQLDRPVLASVTNDKSNRLRHPLMKNVMQARKAMIEHHPAIAVTAPAIVRKVSSLRQTRPEDQCRYLDGDFPTQARELAEILRAAVSA